MNGGERAWSDLLLPCRPRTFTGRRALKVVLRAVHLTCAGVFVGAQVLAAGEGAWQQWYLATVATGILMLSLDLHESCAMLLQVRGAVVAVKLLVAAALPWLGGSRTPALLGLMLVACISSHAPAAVRYHLLLGRGRVAAPTSKG